VVNFPREKGRIEKKFSKPYVTFLRKRMGKWTRGFSGGKEVEKGGRRVLDAGGGLIARWLGRVRALGGET